jgi:hypothetical protein
MQELTDLSYFLRYYYSFLTNNNSECLCLLHFTEGSIIEIIITLIEIIITLIEIIFEYQIYLICIYTLVLLIFYECW